MSAVPSDIAASQTEALAVTPKPSKPKKGKTLPAVAANESAASPGPAKAEAKPSEPAAADGSPTPVTARKKSTTPWFIERNERNLRQRETQSFVFLTKKLTLKTHHALEILRSCMEPWSQAMITLSETMRNFKSEEDCVVVDAEVDRYLEECFSAIKTHIARFNKLAEGHGLDLSELEVEYDKPETQTLRVLSPREIRFHSLLIELDQMCEMTDKLWMIKLLSDRHRSQIPYEVKRQITRMVNRARTLVYRAQASNQRAAEARKATEEATSAAVATPTVTAEAVETPQAEAVPS